MKWWTFWNLKKIWNIAFECGNVKHCDVNNKKSEIIISYIKICWTLWNLLRNKPEKILLNKYKLYEMV